MDTTRYQIVKYFQKEGKPSKVLHSVGKLTLEEAQRYCQCPDTRGRGWFCGFRSC